MKESREPKGVSPRETKIPAKRRTLAAVLEEMARVEDRNASLLLKVGKLMADNEAQFLRIETLLFHEKELKQEVERLQIQRHADEKLLQKLQADLEHAHAESVRLQELANVAEHGVGLIRQKAKTPSIYAIANNLSALFNRAPKPNSDGVMSWRSKR